MFNPNDIASNLHKFGYKSWLRVLAIGFCISTAAILFFGAMLAHGQVDLADAPMFTQLNPPATNLMISLDDSGSMTFEILVRGEYDGQFPNPDPETTDNEGFCYVFDDMGDGYNINQSWRQMDAETRKYWRSQWHAVNAVYYNPKVVYEPWPDHKNKTFPPADTQKPLVHPLQTKTLDLDKRAFRVDGLSVPWAHYFVKSEIDGNFYLIILDGPSENKYYIFTTDGGKVPNDKIVTVTEVFNPPADIYRSYAADRQNFANWFTYNRRREFVAKAAIARVLKKLDGVRVGILGINNRIIVPLQPVKAVIDGEFKDETDALIETLYAYKSAGGTPLKAGLEKIGEYYRKNNGDLEGQKGDVPYPADGGACQQSFTLVVTDGYYSDNGHDSVGNADGDKDNEAWGGNKVPYKDDYSDTLADIAMHYYATDLIPEMDNQVPTNKWDGAAHQHMVTFSVAFGVSGTLNPQDYEDDRTNPNYMRFITKKEAPREYGDYVVWPEVPGNRQPESIDDLWHATVNGRGVFVNAGEPQKLVEGISQIINDIKSRQPTSVASVSVNGDPLYAQLNDDILIFQSSYSNTQDEWIGDVKAYELLPVSGEVNSANPKWSAADRLQLKEWSARKIYTYNGSDSGLVFDYDDLTPDQQAYLNSDEEVVKYIKGREISGFRARSQKLADIVHSSPVFENEVVYVGANDGMLHAFDANNGDELFAYVPNLVFENLIKLTDPAYVHQFYVDLTPTVQKGEELLTGSGDQTILVGGLGKGGMGYFALDITNPNTLDQDQVLWEFPQQDTSPDDVLDMGYSYSKPLVVRSYSDQSWIVITGNGYGSPNGNSVLFVLDVSNGAVIRKLVAGTGPDNGLSSPIAVDVDFDEIVDFVYAGDLSGNLWKFDLTSTDADDWDVAFEKDGIKVPLFTALDPNGDPQPITVRPDVMLHPEQHGYIVCFGTGKFLGSSDYNDDRLQTIYGIWDYGDKTFVPPLWSDDDDTEFLGTFRDPDETAQLSNQPETVGLLKQEASEVTVGSGEDEVTVRIVTAENPLWLTEADPDDNQLPNPTGEAANDAGWYLDLDVYTGERVIGDVILRDGILIVIGFIPEPGRCGSGGDSVFMELNAFTGGQLAGVNFDIHDDGSVGQDDYVRIEKDGRTIYVPPSGLKLDGNIQPPAIVKLNETTEKKYLSSTSGGIVEISERAAKTGIAYWMEILP